jgi:hypothetical protein
VVRGHISNPWHQLRPLPAAPLVVCRTIQLLFKRNRRTAEPSWSAYSLWWKCRLRTARRRCADGFSALGKTPRTRAASGSFSDARRCGIHFLCDGLLGRPEESGWDGKGGTVSIISALLFIPSGSAAAVRKVLTDCHGSFGERKVRLR